jgi:hypothetical protein
VYYVRNYFEGEKMMNKRKQIAVLAGMIAPILFVLVFTIEGWLRPGYIPMEMPISALSLGPRGWIQITNFVAFGLLLLLFSRKMFLEFSKENLKRSGPILLIIIALFYLLSGPFVMDHQVSLHGTIHNILGVFVFLLMPISIFIFLRQFNKKPDWQILQRWTLVLGIICAAAVVLFMFPVILLFTMPLKIPGWVEIILDWNGLFQRFAVLPFMVWLFIFSFGFYNLQRHQEES